MSSWAQEADQQEELLSSLTRKVSGVSIDGSGDAGPSEYRGKSNNAGSKPVPSEYDEPMVTPAEISLMQKILRMHLVPTSHNVEVRCKDSNSPLYSIKTFEELHLPRQLLIGVYNCGFNQPSKIQEAALPVLLADPPQNMIAQSQSGTGKTAAFILASLSRVDVEQRYPQVLILSPTYELAVQTGKMAERMARYTRITFCCAVRGKNFSPGAKIQEQVILGTPGKIIDWVFKFKFFDLSRIKVFVLDEADIMISMHGHHDQSIRIHKRLSTKCQNMLFSATYDKDVMQFAEMIIQNPVVIQLRKEEESLENIKQYYVVCSKKEEKFSAISNIYGVLAIGQTIIFCHTRQAAAWLTTQMTQEGHAVALLSGELSIEKRIAELKDFRNAVKRVLIATNVCARGINVEQVTVVINYDLPVDMKGRADCETYLHRIGRAGRFGKSAIAVSMVEGNHNLAVLKQIEEHFGRPIQNLNAEDMEELQKIQQ